MQKFKDFITEKKVSSEEYIFNMHGSHAYPVEPTNAYYKKQSGLKENSSSNHDIHPSLEDTYLYRKNKSISDDDETSKVIDKLHEEHEHTDKGKLYHKHFTEDSKHLTEDLLNNHIHKIPLVFGSFARGLDKHGFVPAKRDFESYSGVGFNLKNVKSVGKSPRGNKVYPQPTFMSSSASKNVANTFAETSGIKKELPDRHIFHWHHKKGQPVGIVGKHSEYPKEHEVLIPRSKSDPKRYHIELLKTDTYKNQHGILTHVHHVRRIPESEITKD